MWPFHCDLSYNSSTDSDGTGARPDKHSIASSTREAWAAHLILMPGAELAVPVLNVQPAGGAMWAKLQAAQQSRASVWRFYKSRDR